MKVYLALNRLSNSIIRNTDLGTDGVDQREVKSNKFIRLLYNMLIVLAHHITLEFYKTLIAFYTKLYHSSCEQR